MKTVLVVLVLFVAALTVVLLVLRGEEFTMPENFPVLESAEIGTEPAPMGETETAIVRAAAQTAFAACGCPTTTAFSRTGANASKCHLRMSSV